MRAGGNREGDGSDVNRRADVLRDPPNVARRLKKDVVCAAVIAVVGHVPEGVGNGRAGFGCGGGGSEHGTLGTKQPVDGVVGSVDVG